MLIFNTVLLWHNIMVWLYGLHYRLLQIADRETDTLFPTSRTGNLWDIVAMQWKLYDQEHLLKLFLLLASGGLSLLY